MVERCHVVSKKSKDVQDFGLNAGLAQKGSEQGIRHKAVC